MDDLQAQDALCEVRISDPERVALARRELLDDEAYARLAELFRTLADSSRAKIVHSLLQQELCTCDLAAITGLSEPAVSQHLRLLRALQLVKTRREGKMVFYSLADAHVRFLLTVTLEHLQHEEGPLRPHPLTSGVAASPPLPGPGVAASPSPPDPLSTTWRGGEQGTAQPPNRRNADVPGYLYGLCKTARTEQTDAEEMLWAVLRDRQLGGNKFRRQHPLGRYLADFFCAERALVVELDGTVHDGDDARAYDQVRTEALESRGLQVLRFRNDEVASDLDGVVSAILAHLSPTHHSSPSPLRGEGDRGGEGEAAARGPGGEGEAVAPVPETRQAPSTRRSRHPTHPEDR